MASPASLLYAGDYVAAFLASYTNIFGMYFYALMVMVIVTVTYIKTQNVTMPAIILTICGTTFSVIFPTGGAGGIEFLTISYVMLAIGVAAILYKLFKS